MSTTKAAKVIELNSSYSLIGTKVLHYKKGDKEIDYPLRKVTQEELFKIRKLGAPGFVLKIGQKLYYTEISTKASLNITSEKAGKHRCGNCRKCRAVPDFNGGCEKVRDCSVETYLKEGKDFDTALELAKKIEKYSFVKWGIEVFNVKQEIFDVIDCGNFQPHVARRQMDVKELRELQLSIEKLYCNS